jgi:hypothetical protein
MRWITSTLVSIGSLSLLGCGGSAPPPKLSRGGEQLASFPDDKGSFEIKYETQATRAARGKGHVATIVASFYQADGTTPMSPPPTGVKVRFGTESSSPTVDLAPSTGDAKSANRFASKPGEYPEVLRGVLMAKINGEAVEAPFSAR